MNGFTTKLKRKLKSTWKPMKMKHDSPKPLGCNQSGHKRDIYSNPSLHKEGKSSQIYNLILHLKGLVKEQQIKPKNSRRREIIKIRAEINDIETNKQTKQNK